MNIFHVIYVIAFPVADIMQRDKLSVKSCGKGLVDMFGHSMFFVTTDHTTVERK